MPPSPPTSPADAAPPRRGARLLLSLLAVVLVTGAVTEGARAWVQQRRAEALRAVAGPGDLRMISSTTCIWCTRAREWLTRHELPFEECFIEHDRTCAAEYERLGRPGTPTMLVRGQPQRGFDAERITRTLQALPASR
ncbi:MAG: glutaredoxin family protein [Burkholderiaceae bacterium]|nr:glutaredoxin family protein [Burkholderiaceae bacterium]